MMTDLQTQGGCTYSILGLGIPLQSSTSETPQFSTVETEVITLITEIFFLGSLDGSGKVVHFRVSLPW